ncbi:cell division protein ZipA [Halomonas urmiana]|uniref:Cell division protein ZipA n=1 Tax=Halomonas urmiana TaxID=490901 RepID=A0A5R8MDE1_9GAMM|nr:cell division protein ZipA [Halomonas urmiana]TLF47620.1 cell division protein ZipA [Halomonas urmiana]
MELREWLIILGLALVTLIVIDGVRRLQRQRRVPRLDQVESTAADEHAEPEVDPDAEARRAEINWELPNGGARVVRPADEGAVRPKPKLQRQEHPGPSRVLSEFRRHAEEVRPAETADDRASTAARHDVGVQQDTAHGTPRASAPRDETSRDRQGDSARPVRREAHADPVSSSQAASAQQDEAARAEHAGLSAGHATAETRREPALTHPEETEVRTAGEAEGIGALAADPEDHDAYADEERYRLVDLEGMGDSLKSGSRRVGSSVQRFGASLQKTLNDRREHKRDQKQRREQARAEKAAREAAQRQKAEQEETVREAERRRLEAEAVARTDDADPLFTPSRGRQQAHEAPASYAEPPWEAPAEAAMDDRPPRDDVVRTHPVLERALRHDVNAEHARETLSHAEEILVISVMSRDEEGFSGTALLDLMLACGLRYGRDMGIFHRFETEDPDSRLQFSMVNVVKPGTFPIEAMDDFRTQGITLLMPLPGASDTAAAFEAMVETAMVIVRHLGGVLKDEHLSVMTAQTVEFARQRVQEFERRNRLNRYQVN